MTQSSPPPKPDYTAAAKGLLRRARYGILSSLSKQVPGYPFGSVLPCALTPGGEPILFISTLAAHTQNILADPHVSFTVIEPNSSAETQASGRFTYLGIAEPVAEADRSTVRERFLSLVPSAQIYSDFGDFSLYTIRFTKGRYVGGFGAIGWIHADLYNQADPVVQLATANLSQLEALCRDRLQQFARVHHAERIALVNADNQGCDIRLNDAVRRLEYAELLACDSSLQDIAQAIEQSITEADAS